jgi:hypothetical protein
MPRGLKVIFVINSLLIIAYSVALFFYGAMLRQNSPPVLFASGITLGGLCCLQVIMLFRLQRLLAFIRLLIYVIAIVQGLLVMLLLKDLFSIPGILIIASAVCLIIYFIGVRGYLSSNTSLSYFGFLPAVVNRSAASDQ